MRYFNCFIIFCVSVLLQVEAKDFSGTSRDEEDISELAKIAFEDLEEIITAIINIARESISGVESTIAILQDAILKLAKDAINLLGAEIVAKLDELKKEADILGVDIIECTEDRENDIKQLFVTFLNKTSLCAIKRIDNVFDSFSDILMDVDNANNLLKNLTRQLENCKDKENEDTCIAKVLEEITDAAVKVPPKVMEDVNKSKKLMKELENYLFECYHDNNNEMEITSMEIYNGIVECIKGKL